MKFIAPLNHVIPDFQLMRKKNHILCLLSQGESQEKSRSSFYINTKFHKEKRGGSTTHVPPFSGRQRGLFFFDTEFWLWFTYARRDFTLPISRGKLIDWRVEKLATRKMTIQPALYHFVRIICALVNENKIQFRDGLSGWIESKGMPQICKIWNLVDCTWMQLWFLRYFFITNAFLFFGWNFLNLDLDSF